MNEPFKLSLIICTKNRAQQLMSCLESVQKIQSDICWQLIIVNNGSSDNTQEVITSFINSSSISTLALMEHSPGLSHSRNAGWYAATSEYIAYIDDDCYPAVNYIDSLVNIFNQYPALGFVGGKVLLFDKTDFPITIQTYNRPIEFSPYTAITTGKIHGANFAFRREALVAAKGFDIRFGAGKKYPCEDVDTMAEVLRLGWYGRYDPQAVVFHHHKRKLQRDVDTLMKAYDKGRGAFYAKQICKPNLGKMYFLIWLKAIRWQSFSVTFREIMGACEFCKDSLLKK